MPVSKRIRFEVFKRDGFRCVYCGASPTGSLLHADHVIPKSKGGPDDIGNLVTACAGCNLGKSNVSLGAAEASFMVIPDVDEIVERAEQTREYAAVLGLMADAEADVCDAFETLWSSVVCTDAPYSLRPKWAALDAEHGCDVIVNAMRAVSVRDNRGWIGGQDAHAQYFCGVLRKMKRDSA